MITRYKIMRGSTEVKDFGEHVAFSLDGIDYPADWIERGGVVVGHTIKSYDATPPPPPTPEPSATGAQMIDEAKERNKLVALLTALTASEKAMFYTRRRIVAGGNFAEVLRGKLGISALVMSGFIAAAAARTELE